jgi:alpha-mannosidase
MYWKLALAQHPMYFLIKNDTGCAERTPPWGAPDIDHYIERLRANIAMQRKFPQVKFGYEWSGLELEQLKEDAPDVFEEMLDLVKSGQSTFYNGTYSQPHLQTLSSEANYRQFEWGSRIYRQLCKNHQVIAYAHQESSINDQTPQLLKAFGITYGVIPRFYSNLALLDGGEFYYQSRFGTMFTHGEEFGIWRGLDGTERDLFLLGPNYLRIKDWLAFQEILGLMHVPPVLVQIPDLEGIDQEWIEDRSQAEFVLLDNALEERRKAFPPRFHLRFYTNWSYIEGIRAEELSRGNWSAETAALQAEALNALAFTLIQRDPDSTDLVWKIILTTQHHDAYCFCAPELRAKSIGWLQEAKAEAGGLARKAGQAIASQIDTSKVTGQPLVLFNTSPNPVQVIASAEVDVAAPVIVGADGRTLPTDAVPLPTGKTLVRFLARLPGLGYQTFGVQASSQTFVEETISNHFVFENSFFKATLQPDGTFTSLVLKPSAEELFAGAGCPGNQLAARDSTGLGPKHEGTFDLAHWVKWEPSERGPELKWQVTNSAQLRRNPLGATVTIAGEMGANVKATLVVNFYNDLARIDLDWVFAFDEASIGHFFDDDTKLRVQWPLAFKGDIHHDISFGVVDTRAERPFLPASWVDISDGKKGLAYFHQGTLKHWVNGNTLVNLFAWGEDTDAIGNRIDMVRWPKCFDQRLNGIHVIHTAIYPHSGDWRSANVIGVARSFGVPPIALTTDRHGGILPTELTALQINLPELVSTAVKVEDDQVLCRFYSVSHQAEHVEPVAERLKLAGTKRLTGEPGEWIGPFQIGMMLFNPD